MRCMLERTAPADRHCWVRWSAFLHVVDLDDLACHNSAVIADRYLSSWLHIGPDGEALFTPPAFEMRGVRAFFINGRHRALLLARHVPSVPMALTRIVGSSEAVLQSFVEGWIPQGCPVELPDLPIVEGTEQ